MKHIILVGFMGAGKSTLGRALSQQLSMPFIDTDHYITLKTGKNIQEIFQKSGEAAFRRFEREALLEIVQLPPSIIATGGGMPCFLDNMKVMNDHGTTVYLQAPPEQLCQLLLRSGNKRPLIAGKSEQELLQYVTDTLAAREQYYLRAKIKVSAHSMEPKALAQSLIAEL